MADWWITPDVPPDRWPWFVGTLVWLVVLQTVFSPRRRRALGLIPFMLGHACLIVVPLLGVFIVRSGFRHAFVQAGYGWWSAMWLSLFWMMVFITVGQLAIRWLPPTSWLIRELNRAGKEIWMERLKRWFGVRA